ncbi:hypothetical protein CV683_04770 [Borreliella burgdorferi]|uniref:hypothetical protein n=1 Tax=Borreliella burgdorferi TaxID=139 RepID=UPI00017F2DF4|nr:hypothetical protein [Borreliella burgdorferi]ADQ29870.1 conserved hypothetical protein [Borreliella burgdorferi N40]PRQ90857.1 hypothetical protein CV691_05415 [Borreliella burgdorferi]PRR13739.1 hypothetical protein CV656_05650 [Borreliella burgdorferi]PRR15835.1 hypothetical protein CV649_05370 [Borreliella burgdorferi]PRR19487.1 hypothetical protein CV647_05165 [Borreliella burgdorferi]
MGELVIPSRNSLWNWYKYNPKMILKIFLILLYLEHFKLSKAKINKMLNLNSKDEFFKEKENNFIVAGLIF